MTTQVDADETRPSRSKTDQPPATGKIENVGLVVAAVSAAMLSGRPGIGLGVALLAAVGATVLVLRHDKATKRWCAASLTLVPWLVIRDNPWLAISIVSTVALVIGLSLLAGATNRSIWDLPIRSLFRREPAEVTTESVRPTTTVFGRVIIGLVFAVPIVGVFYLLLASADEVFASIVDLSSVPVVRLVLFLIIAPVATVLLRFGAIGRASPKPSEVQRFGSLESSIVLGAVSLLFGAFIAVRFATIGRSLDDLGLRDEVRSGFFQLLWVAALAVLLVLAIREVRGVSLDPMVRRFGLLVIALAGVIDGLALYRIWQYVDQSFLTQLRVWSFGFGLWLLVVLMLAALRLSGVRTNLDWFTGAVVSAWLVFVLVMAAANPDARIAEHNFANPPTGANEWISVIPLMELSEDATPVIVQNIDALRPMPNDRFERVASHLCETPSDSYPREFNVSRRAAASSIQELCDRD